MAKKKSNDEPGGIIETAEYYRREFAARLFPLKKRIVGSEKSKSPLHTGWQTKTYSADDIRRYQKKGHAIGWALTENDLVVDVDAPTPERPDKQGLISLPKLIDDIGKFKTAEVKSPSGGRHIYFSKRGDVPIRKVIAERYPGIDFISKGGYVAIAGSPHWQGGEYEFTNDDDRALAPKALLETLKKPDRESSGERSEISVGQLRQVLELLDPSDYAENDSWLPLMMAAHSGTNGDGLEAFLNWSTSDPIYSQDAGIIETRWGSLTDAPGNVTIATLIREARSVSNGEVDEIFGTGSARPDRPGPPEDDFDAIEDDEPKKDDERFPSMSWDEADEVDVKVEFLIDRVMVRGEPMIVAGPEKSFKTTTLLEMAVSLAAGVPFFGEYDVPRPVRTMLMSGETSFPTIQRNVRAIRESKGIERGPLDKNFRISTVIPYIDKRIELATLKKEVIERYGIEVLIIDPTYFAISADQTSLTAVGDVLRKFSRVCQECNVTTILCHHTKKGTDTEYKPIHRSQITGAGYGAFMAQWTYVNLRSPFRHWSPNEVWYQFGARSFAGHTVAVDIDEGKQANIALAYKYQTTIRHDVSPYKKESKSAELGEAIVEAIRSDPDGFIGIKKIAEEVGSDCRNSGFKSTIKLLIQKCRVELKDRRRKGQRAYPCYQLTEPEFDGHELF